MKVFFLVISFLAINSLFPNISYAINYVNVESHGANGSDSIDDTTAIQQALNTNQPIYFPKGKYYVSSTLNYHGHRIVSDGATIIGTDNTRNILEIRYPNSLYVGGLQLEYENEQTDITSANHPLRIWQCSDFIIEKIGIKNGGGIYIQQSNNGIVRNCQALNSVYKAFEIRSSHDVLVEKCYAQKNVSAFSTEDSYNLQIVNNSGEDSHSAAVRVEDSNGVIVKNNAFYNSKTGLVAYGPGSGSSLQTNNIGFIGNILNNCFRTNTCDSLETYTNNICEFAMSTKMDVHDVDFVNNIVVGKDESTLLTDLSGFTLWQDWKSSFTYDELTIKIPSEDYYTVLPNVLCAYIFRQGGLTENGRLFEFYFPNGIDLSQERVMTIDLYWGGSEMYEDSMAVRLFSECPATSSSFICQTPLYNPYDYVALPCIIRIPDNVDVSSVKSIMISKFKGCANGSHPEKIAVSEIRKGLQAKIGYLHNYYGNSYNPNVILDSNAYIGIGTSYLYNRRYKNAPDATIIGSEPKGSTLSRPSNPEYEWRYFDTTLDNPIFWDGSEWRDICTYWPEHKINETIDFDGTKHISLSKDDRVNLNEYTIEGWLKTSVDNKSQIIVERESHGLNPYGYLFQLTSSNNLIAYQSVGGNFYNLSVGCKFPYDNEYHHVAITYKYQYGLSYLRLYIDGVLKDSATMAAAPDYPPASSEIKCGYNFEGKIDKLCFYPKALDGTEVAKLAKRFREDKYAYWRFDETDGLECFDSSPYGSESILSHNVGLLNNMVLPGCRVDDGKQGKALSFVDGQNDYVDLGNPDWINATNYTISAWVKPTTSLVADRHLIQRCNIGAPNGHLMLLWTTNKLCAYQSVGGNFYAVMTSADFPHDGQYHHVAMAFSYDGTTSELKLYIDGNLVDSESIAGAPDAPPSSETLKCGLGRFKGNIDEVKFYSRTLHAAEIMEEFEKNGKW